VVQFSYLVDGHAQTTKTLKEVVPTNCSDTIFHLNLRRIACRLEFSEDAITVQQFVDQKW